MTGPSGKWHTLVEPSTGSLGRQYRNFHARRIRMKRYHHQERLTSESSGRGLISSREIRVPVIARSLRLASLLCQKVGHAAHPGC